MVSFKIVMDAFAKWWSNDPRDSESYVFDKFEPPPVLWETMVFGGPRDVSEWRYISLEDARMGHKKAVEIAFEWRAEDRTVEGVSQSSDV